MTAQKAPKERSLRGSILEDYCFARGIPFEPARFTVTDAELRAWLDEDSLDEDVRLLTRDVERARHGDRRAIDLLGSMDLLDVVHEVP